MFSSGIGSVRLKSDPAYKGKSNGKISMAVIMDRPWYINSEHEEYFTSSVTDPSTIVAARVWRNDNDRYVLLKQDNIQTLLCVHSTGSKPVYGSELDIRTKRAA